MGRWLTVAAALLGAAFMSAVPSARADTAVVVLGASEVELDPAEGGGGTASVALTNLTNAGIAVSAKPQTPRPQCEVTLDNNGRLGAARTTTVEATITSGCGAIDDSFRFVVVPGKGRELPVTATSTVDTPDWDPLAWFWRCTLLALLLALAAYGTWMLKSRQAYWPWERLPYLADSWSFKDSWVSNVTVVGGLLAGIFGSSEVVKAMLGKDAEESVALATIGGAVSIALIGAAGVIVIALKTLGDGKFTVGGVLLGSTVALGAAGGQLVVVYEAAKDFELGGREDDLTPFLIAALIVLVAYGFLSLLGVLIQGHTKPTSRDPATDPVSEAVFAAAVLAAAARPNSPVQREEVQSVLRALKPPPRPKPTRRAEGAKEAEPPQAVPSVLTDDALLVAPARVSGRSALP